jgi:DNA-binding MarR family transcriptional regulator
VTNQGGRFQHSRETVDMVMRALRTYAGSVENYMAGAGGDQRLHRTDLGALAVIMDQTSRGVLVTPTQIGHRMRLSTSATTSMLDRLERSGHVVRSPHPHDRRSVVLEVTPLTHQVGREVFGRLGQATAAAMQEYDPSQLEVIASFLERVAQVTDEVAAGQDG